MVDNSNNLNRVQEAPELRFHVVDTELFDLAPAERTRDWMDDTKGYAYRCLPLSMANAHGWVFRCVEGFEAEWDGSGHPDGIKLYPKNAPGPNNILRSANTKFGEGILTFRVGAIVRTPPGYNLWISGVPNQFKDGIQALSALVECDWIPYTFTVNWKFTRANSRVQFDIGEPIAFIFPVQRGTLQSMQPTLYDINDNPNNPDNPELVKLYGKARTWREFDVYVKRRKPEHSWFQGWYMRGSIPFTGRTFKEHERTIKLKPLMDFRKPGAADR